MGTIVNWACRPAVRAPHRQTVPACGSPPPSPRRLQAQARAISLVLFLVMISTACARASRLARWIGRAFPAVTTPVFIGLLIFTPAIWCCVSRAYFDLQPAHIHARAGGKVLPRAGRVCYMV